MDNPYLNAPSSGPKLFQSLGIILRLIGFVIVGGVIATLLFSLVSGIGIESLQRIASDPKPEDKMLLWGLQGINQLFMFIVLPALYIYFFNRRLIPQFFHQHKKLGWYFLIALLIIFSSVPLINWLAEWNKSLELPAFMEGIEAWMKSKEMDAKKLTDLIAYYSNTLELFIALFVIAILPAIGEEFLFRGIIQNEFSAVMKNPHVAIWITGFIFSFVHFQFYGFFPRMFLGVIFGYLYYWSGNLWVPVLIHFLNNAMTLFALNLYKQKVIEIDPESAEALPVASIIISLLIFSILLLTFKKLKNQTT